MLAADEARVLDLDLGLELDLDWRRAADADVTRLRVLDVTDLLDDVTRLRFDDVEVDRDLDDDEWRRLRAAAAADDDDEADFDVELLALPVDSSAITITHTHTVYTAECCKDFSFTAPFVPSISLSVAQSAVSSEGPTQRNEIWISGATYGAGTGVTECQYAVIRLTIR